jgi:hypothetical protein
MQGMEREEELLHFLSLVQINESDLLLIEGGKRVN